MASKSKEMTFEQIERLLRKMLPLHGITMRLAEPLSEAETFGGLFTGDYYRVQVRGNELAGHFPAGGPPRMWRGLARNIRDHHAIPVRVWLRTPA